MPVASTRTLFPRRWASGSSAPGTKADPRYTRDVFQLHDQARRLGGHPASDGYWFGPVEQIAVPGRFREHHPGSALREYWLALRAANRLLGIPVPDAEAEVLRFLRRIED